MKILIDGMNLALEQGTGVATYSRNLSYCLKASGHHVSALYGKRMPAFRDPLLREAAFHDNEASRRYFHPLPLVMARGLFAQKAARIPQTGKVLTDHIAASLPEADEYLNVRRLFDMADLRARWAKGVLDIRLPEPVDVAHWTYPIPARIVGAKNIYTIHDMVPIKLPYATLDSKALHYRILRMLARTADHFVTVSECSKRDIVDLLGVDESFVSNTYQSVRIPADLLAEPEEQRRIDLAAINLGPGVERLSPGGFYLFVGAIEPKKNLRRLIEAHLSAGVAEPLVVVGRKAWRYEDEVKVMERSRRIHYLDYLPFRQLVTLMRAARALVFPSLYEGFGLPVLEAFLCGTPVITSDASSTREVAGGAALLANPYSVREIRDAIRRLSGPEGEALRADLAARGLKRAERFSETRIAADLDAMYRRIAGGK